MSNPFLQFDPHFSDGAPNTSQLQPYKTVIVQDEYVHNKGRLIISGKDWNGDRYKTGTPVTVTWGWQGGATSQINGYIEYAQRIEEVGHLSKSLYLPPDLAQEIIILDATWVQKQPQFFIYKNRTVPQVVQVVANQFKLAALVEDHPQVWPVLSQHGGESTFDFLARISKLIGFILLGNGTTIVCMSRQQLVDRAFQGGYIPVFGERAAPVLAKLKTVTGQENPQSPYRTTHLWGIDQRTGRIISLNEDVNADKTTGQFLGSVTYDPLFDKNNTSKSFSDVGTGQAVLKGSALQHEFYHRAEIMTVGDPKITHGSVIFLDKSYGDRESGYWYVHRAEHHLEVGPNQLQLSAEQNLTQSYFCRLTIGRDSSGVHGEPPTPGVVHIPGSGRRGGRGGRHRGRGGGGPVAVIPPSSDPIDQSRIDSDPPIPPTVLVQDLWRSAFSQRDCSRTRAALLSEVTDYFTQTNAPDSGAGSQPTAGFVPPPAPPPSSPPATSLKRVLGGVLDRDGEPPTASYRPTANNFVVKVNWADLQPTQGGPIATNNAVDQAITTVRALQAADPSHIYRIKIRAYAGINAPTWAKNLGGAPFTMTSGNTSGTVGRWWRSDYISAYTTFVQLMAAKYDGTPEVADFVCSGTSGVFDEPLIRDASDPTSVANLISAGFTQAADDTAIHAQIDACTVWTQTRVSMAFNPYQRINANGSTSNDEVYTESIIDYLRQQIPGSVLGNNSIGKASQGSLYPPMYNKIVTMGPPIYYQTATLDKITSLANALQWAINNGANYVELPTGYDGANSGLTLNQLASYDSQLENQPQGPH